MTLLDYAVFAIVGFSVLLSVIRGLVREVLALAAWAIAFVVAWLLGSELATLMPEEIPSMELRLLAGFATVFFLALLAMSLVAIAASQLVKSAGLGVEDRMLGAMFGLARGLLVVMVLVLAAGATSLPAEPVWREAALRPLLERAALGIRDWLPPAIGQHIKYG
ncbi:MAG: CvpA family protein [Burkholderiales bacterium]|nr:CvpA family protein [Burkholderiales bacterium]MDP2400177.1 CvpA family protein [Burkholderiales bacterium]